MKKKVLYGAIAALLLMQLVPLDRGNPSVEGEIQAPAEVQAILERSCYDCHSNETKWPWYAYVAPVSFFVSHHVEEGREHLNFSTWSRYDTKKQAHKVEEMVEETGEGEMPLWSHVLIHGEAALSSQDKATLVAWAKQAYGVEVKPDQGHH